MQRARESVESLPANVVIDDILQVHEGISSGDERKQDSPCAPRVHFPSVVAASGKPLRRRVADDSADFGEVLDLKRAENANRLALQRNRTKPRAPEVVRTTKS